MVRRVAGGAGLFLLLAMVVAHAGSKAGMARPATSCDGNTYEMVECLKAKTAVWDKRLNDAYQKALQAAGVRQQEQLRTAQRLWAQYRDANCLYYGLGEGTIARLDAGECMRRATETRAGELESVGDP